MGLLTAPYNNAMRLGQGFNSYTQEICVDDAVLVSPFRAENILTNDGNTMRLTALLRGKPSAWVKQAEVIADEQQYKEVQETLKAMDEEKKYIQEQSASTSVKEVKVIEHVKAPSPPSMLTAEPKTIEVVPAPSLPPASPALTPEAEQNVDANVTSMTKSLSTASSYELVGGETERSSVLSSADPPNEPEKSTLPETVAKKTKKRTKKSATDTDAKQPETYSNIPASAEEKLETVSENLGAKEGQKNEEKAEKTEVKAKKSDSTDPELPLDAVNPVTQIHSAEDPKGDEHQDKADPKSGEAGSATAEQATGTNTDEGASKLLESASKDEDGVAKKEETQLEKEVRLKRAEADRTRARKRLVGHEDAKKAAEAYSRPLMSLEKMIQMEKAHKSFGGQRDLGGVTSKNSENTKVFNIKSSHGVSQTVVYRSHFIDKLSDVADDMGISAALSVTGDSFSVAGRGSFIKTDKFKDSDLNYYISVKVINQSINFKDALEFNPLDNIADEDFRSVFGDCFISGFLEGGELNAVISMKILNTTKATDLAIEGSLAVAGEKWGIKAEAAFRTAKTNLDLNTETTVQVSWLGGGIIKPPEEPWTIESLTRAATRFPDMVAASPQRTHAILTKYENLRSYMALKPPSITPLDYENASLYTNELMDTFMTYKSVYSRLSSQIASVQSGNLKFKTVDEKERTFTVSKEIESAALDTLSDEQKKARIGYFPSTLDGLDAARQSIRSQMNMIIARVVDITKTPSNVLDKPKEKFLSPFSFESLLPPMISAFKPRLGAPLTNERMYSSADAKAGTDSSIEEVYGTMVDGHKLCLVRETAECKKEFKFFKEEVEMIERYLASRDDGVEKFLRLTPLFGNVEKRMGNFFTSLDFVQADFVPSLVRVFMEDGVVVGMMCKYANGLLWKRGNTDAETIKSNASSSSTNALTQNVSMRMATDERITSVIVTVGAEGNADPALEWILGLKFATNKGQQIDVQAPSTRSGFRRRVVGKRAYFNVRAITFESPLERGYLCGFWGRSDETKTSYGVFRLGAVWANGAPSNRPNDATANVKKEKTLDEQLAQQADAEHQAKLDEQVRMKLNEIKALNTKMDKLRTIITAEIIKSSTQSGQEAEFSTTSKEEPEAELLERLIRVKADELSKAKEEDKKTLDAAIAKEKAFLATNLLEAEKTAEANVTSAKKAVKEEWEEKLTLAGKSAEENLTSAKDAVKKEWEGKLTLANKAAEDNVASAKKAVQREWEGKLKLAENTARSKTRAREVISVLRNFRIQLLTRQGFSIDCHAGILTKAMIASSHSGANQTLFMSDIDGESFSLAMDFHVTRWLVVETRSSDVHNVKFTDRHDNVALWTLEVRDDGKYRFAWKNTDFHLTFDGEPNVEWSDLLIRNQSTENEWWSMRYLSIR